jgi:hypothetical protein
MQAPLDLAQKAELAGLGVERVTTRGSESR